MTDLAQRYGAPSPARRRAVMAIAVLLAAAGLGWLTWAAVEQSTPEVRSELVSYDIVDEHTATAVLSVVRADAGVRASCYLRAIAEDHATVGELTGAVSSGPAEQRVTMTIRTERRATTVERLGCTAPGQNQRK